MKFPPIRKIDIEIHSFCNRKCEWCPNNIYDRSSMEIMPDEIYSKIIDELSQNNYNQCISFTRFNEAFADKELLKRRIREAREKIPDAYLICNTNGDYDYNDVDLDALTVMDYDDKLKEFCDEDIGLRIMKLKDIHNRADSIEYKNKSKRKYPCIEPKYFIGIDYEGYIYFCCNMIKECESHKPYVFGSILDTTIKEAYHSEPAKEFRKRTMEMKFPKPCEYCQMKASRYIKGKYSLCDDMEDWILNE